MDFGFLGKLFAGLFNSFTKRRDIKFAFDLERAKLKEIEKRAYLLKNIDKLEEAYEITEVISNEFSQTVGYITSSINMSKEQYHMRYLEKSKCLDRLSAIAGIYFPELSGLVGKLSGQTNILWGAQQNLLYQKEKGCDHVTYMEALNKVTEASREVDGIVYSLQYKLSQLSSSLRESLGLA